MEKKRLLSLVLVVLVLISFGCRNGRRGDEPSEVNYRTGTNGLEITFPTNTPTKIYENDRDVKFIVEVRNKGAFPQYEELNEFFGKLWIGGYDDRILTIHPRTGSIQHGMSLIEDELEGISPYNLDGGYSAVEFEMRVDDLPEGMPYYRPTIMVTASYAYKTIANPTLCIDPEPRSTKIREKACSMTDSISAGSQGAPVQITRVEQDVTSSDILFKIYLQNAGNGLIIQESQVDDNPNQGYDWRDLDLVTIGDVRLGDLPMSECRPSIGRDVHLIEGKGYIFCRMSKTRILDQAYQTPMNIVLRYGYTTSVNMPIEIFEEVSFS